MTRALAVQLMRLADVPLDPRDRVFRYSKLRALLGAAMVAAISHAVLLVGWFKSVWPAYYVAAVLSLCVLMLQKLVTARFRPSNWLLRMTDHGRFIKFRSYLL